MIICTLCRPNFIHTHDTHHTWSIIVRERWLRKFDFENLRNLFEDPRPHSSWRLSFSTSRETKTCHYHLIKTVHSPKLFAQATVKFWRVHWAKANPPFHWEKKPCGICASGASKAIIDLQAFSQCIGGSLTWVNLFSSIWAKLVHWCEWVDPSRQFTSHFQKWRKGHTSLGNQEIRLKNLTLCFTPR